MPRLINLRQIEGFKALIEHGTVSRAAEIMHISQPAMSQLISHLEEDAGLRLFDRVKGRLMPTERGMRLYDEVGRIFAGVRQVENAVEVIRREERGSLSIGVMPALAGSFMPRVTAAFLASRGDVFCSVQQMSSQWIVDFLVERKLDLGLVGYGFDNPYLKLEPLLEHPLVCVMPAEHRLAELKTIEPQHLEDEAFISMHPDTFVGRQVQSVLERHKAKPRVVLMANVASTLCECVAAGIGVSLTHPLSVSGADRRLTVRRFEPEIIYSYQLGHGIALRNTELVTSFADELRTTAQQVSAAMLERD
jgi:DNA-binding transcriptional LysR family regulator